jgi:hypothetical protein
MSLTEKSMSRKLELMAVLPNMMPGNSIRMSTKKTAVSLAALLHNYNHQI